MKFSRYFPDRSSGHQGLKLSLKALITGQLTLSCDLYVFGHLLMYQSVVFR